ncbi:hypothetical protein [Mycobacterium paraterrae]|uniref:Uncharacterized protein n=1 Tax=Mycobacterium paraterrae TaxID=577492 RepID=A0ABY3VKS8_9MYCO|nr:hypothetical protein [Mycobacterium paraterrae]UMB70020.1 hypothetical protein MKK62_01270 [Mycobacterium paraterrae]
MGVARGLAAGGTFAAVAAGLAFHAAGEPPIGRYTAMAIDDATGLEVPGMTSTLTFVACGPGCAHVLSPTGAFDLHLRDGAWTGTAKSLSGQSCTDTVDARLFMTQSCAGKTSHAQLKKSG